MEVYINDNDKYLSPKQVVEERFSRKNKINDFSDTLANFIEYIQENKIDYSTFKRLVNIVEQNYQDSLLKQQHETYLEISDATKQWYKLKK